MFKSTRVFFFAFVAVFFFGFLSVAKAEEAKREVYVSAGRYADDGFGLSTGIGISIPGEDSPVRWSGIGFDYDRIDGLLGLFLTGQVAYGHPPFYGYMEFGVGNLEGTHAHKHSLGLAARFFSFTEIIYEYADWWTFGFARPDPSAHLIGIRFHF